MFQLPLLLLKSGVDMSKCKGRPRSSIQRPTLQSNQQAHKPDLLSLPDEVLALIALKIVDHKGISGWRDPAITCSRLWNLQLPPPPPNNSNIWGYDKLAPSQRLTLSGEGHFLHFTLLIRQQSIRGNVMPTFLPWSPKWGMAMQGLKSADSSRRPDREKAARDGHLPGTTSFMGRDWGL